MTKAVHAFCSAKGGVGKTALAVGAAKTLAEQGGSCLLIDADLTGTSLADGLDLRAPVVRSDDGERLDLESEPSGRHHSVPQTRALRRKRALDGNIGEPTHLPYFNDVVGFLPQEGSTDCRLRPLLWRGEPSERGVLYLPSSPLRRDVGQALSWLYRPDQSAWQRRLAWILWAVQEQLDEVTDVVVDLPPGLFGFAESTLGICAHIASGIPLPEGSPELVTDPPSWHARAYLVMTQDRNDWLAALGAFPKLYRQLPTLAPVMNRVTVAHGDLQARIRAELPPLGLEDRLRFVQHDERGLGRLFLDGDLPLTDDIRRSMHGVLGPEGGPK